MRHVFNLTKPAEKINSRDFSDGAITGNGDLSVIWGGTTDRVRLNIGKSDFWNGNGVVKRVPRGGKAPLGLIEILLPEFSHSPYEVEQDMDRALLTGHYRHKNFDATLQVTVCAEENTILLEMERSFPGLSSSIQLLPLMNSDAITECDVKGDVQYTLRGFDAEDSYFPTYALSAIRKISRRQEGNRERIRWAVCVATNHDTAAYRRIVFERIAAIDDDAFEKKQEIHARWWKDFWAKSGISLPDEDLENHWYMGIYGMACCARNEKFPPGLYGTYGTSDQQKWFGDYHLNYNHEAPFYALMASNHIELTDCYMAPIEAYLPIAKRFAKEYMGCRGAYYPVALGPLGMETDIRPETKEHGHLFLGQKSNGAYCCVIPMMRWYSTLDKEYAKSVYPFLCEVGDFWEDYLVFEDGRYVIYNDYLHETDTWVGPDYIPPKGTFDQVNNILSLSMVRAVMKLLLDVSAALGVDEDRREKRQHILDHLSEIKTTEKDGVPVLLESEYDELKLDFLSLRSVYPSECVGKYTTPELYQVAQNTMEAHKNWASGTTCEVGPTAARLESDPEKLISFLRESIQEHQLPNGLFDYGAGGVENFTNILGAVNEMLLQSNEHIVRLFPCWDRTQDASFHGFRAYGAFVVDGSVKNGEIRAEIISEKGSLLRLECPGEGYVVSYRGNTVPLTDVITDFETECGEQITLFRRS